MIKNSRFLVDLEDDDTNVFCKSIIDRYEHRPQELASMCLAEFVANYQVSYASNSDDDNDVMPPPEDIDVTSLKKIKLTDNFGTMVKRKQEAVIRFHKYSKDSDPSNWYRSRLMLYYLTILGIMKKLTCLVAMNVMKSTITMFCQLLLKMNASTQQLMWRI